MEVCKISFTLYMELLTFLCLKISGNCTILQNQKKTSRIVPNDSLMTCLNPIFYTFTKLKKKSCEHVYYAALDNSNKTFLG